MSEGSQKHDHNGHDRGVLWQPQFAWRRKRWGHGSNCGGSLWQRENQLEPRSRREKSITVDNDSSSLRTQNHSVHRRWGWQEDMLGVCGRPKKRSRDEQDETLSPFSDSKSCAQNKTEESLMFPSQHTSFEILRGSEDNNKGHTVRTNAWTTMPSRKRRGVDAFDELAQGRDDQNFSNSSAFRVDTRNFIENAGDQSARYGFSLGSGPQMPPKESQRYQALWSSDLSSGSCSSKKSVIDLTVDHEPVDLVSDDDTLENDETCTKATRQETRSEAGNKGKGTRNDPIELDVDIIHQCLIDLLSGKTDARRKLSQPTESLPTVEDSKPSANNETAKHGTRSEDLESQHAPVNDSCCPRMDQQAPSQQNQQLHNEEKKQSHRLQEPQPVSAKHQPPNERRVTHNEAEDIYRSARDEVFNLDLEIRRLIQQRRQFQPSRNERGEEEIENRIVELKKRRHLAGQLAADDIYRRMNSCAGMGWDVGNSDGRSIVKVDFHGLHKKDVQRKVDELLIPVLPTLSQIIVVTGKGRHSRDGISHLRKELVSLLESVPYRENMNWEPVRGNHGAILIRWTGARVA